jgi:molybdenum cofactor cytidylyltransferase
MIQQPTNNSIGALVLAAGSGARIGTPKLRLEREGTSYLEHILDLLGLAGIRTIVSIIAPGQAEWAGQFSGKSVLAINPHPEQGMFSSIQLGVAALSARAGLFIVPVDHPFVEASTFHLLEQEFLQNSDAIIKPSFRSQPGHPIIIPQNVYDAVLAAAPHSSLRHVLHHMDTRRIFVKVNDAGILKNINERSDLPGYPP